MGFAIAPDGELSTLWTTTSVLEYIFCWGFGREKKRKRELPPVARTTDLLLAFSASCDNRTDIRSVRVESLYSSCYLRQAKQYTFSFDPSIVIMF